MTCAHDDVGDEAGSRPVDVCYPADGTVEKECRGYDDRRDGLATVVVQTASTYSS